MMKLNDGVCNDNGDDDNTEDDDGGQMNCVILRVIMQQGKDNRVMFDESDDENTDGVMRL